MMQLTGACRPYQAEVVFTKWALVDSFLRFSRGTHWRLARETKFFHALYAVHSSVSESRSSVTSGHIRASIVHSEIYIDAKMLVRYAPR